MEEFGKNLEISLECKIRPTEFFDIAAQQGFYGVERGGLTGKKDYVRKYWEDITTKLTIREPVERLLEKRSEIRVVDLGCGSGEGFDLLTHIPPSKPLNSKKNVTLSPEQISSYIGVDISNSMIRQGRMNYENVENVKFKRLDLNEGFQLIDEQPFDIYFSSYSSLSHLEPDKLIKLIGEILNHAEPGAFIVFDLLGKFSPEWPKYWNINSQILPYNMAYLIPSELREKEQLHWYNVCFWTPSELYQVLDHTTRKSNSRIQITHCVDRSIFVGRHMETGVFEAPRLNYRYEVNRLFDYDHRVDVNKLFIDLSWCEELGKKHPEIFTRLSDYKEKWNCVILLVDALIQGNNQRISYLIETTPPDISNELKFLTWLYRNAHRFPVIDFWASVMGPQIAMILRNIEMCLQPALGCGHGLLCVVEIIE